VSIEDLPVDTIGLVGGIILKVANIDLVVKSITLEVIRKDLKVESVCLRVFDTGLINSAILVLVTLSLELRGILILETGKDLKL
jgi:hypothetical protein